jgi:tetratricopeptide (TPR) repeat protein
MRLSLAGLTLVAFVSGVAIPRARAQTPSEAGEPKNLSATASEARAHYKQGVAHFNLDEWKPAMEEFKTAYRLYPDPTFLYNIALCHRKLGEHAEALSFYKKYLREPGAKNRDEVQRRIAELETIVAAEAKAPHKTEPPPPPPPAQNLKPPPPAATPNLTPPPVVAPPLAPAREPALEIGAAPPPPEEAAAPLYKKWWLWAGVGAVVVAGTLTAVALSGGGSAGAPMYHPGDLSPGQITVPTK